MIFLPFSKRLQQSLPHCVEHVIAGCGSHSSVVVAMSRQVGVVGVILSRVWHTVGAPVVGEGGLVVAGARVAATVPFTARHHDH